VLANKRDTPHFFLAVKILQNTSEGILEENQVPVILASNSSWPGARKDPISREGENQAV
jgi:hypothetical protein